MLTFFCLKCCLQFRKLTFLLKEIIKIIQQCVIKQTIVTYEETMFFKNLK